jgi:hypothetical protein
MISVYKRIFAIISRGFYPFPQIRYKEQFYKALLDLPPHPNLLQPGEKGP